QEKARLVEPKSFEGVKALALEWDVAPDEAFHAFHAVNAIGIEGGVLRVYVIPEYGFVVPLVEHIGKDGRPQRTYMARKFREVASGVFYPMEWELQSYDDTGPGYRVEFRIHEISLVNQEIPSSDFVVALPIGTGVLDAHAGEINRF